MCVHKIIRKNTSSYNLSLSCSFIFYLLTKTVHNENCYLMEEDEEWKDDQYYHQFF
jgi:hypothetical protein